jgi:glyoxylase-like metal-dependent hydrolase (beta-lactamase superfamily II)
VTPTTRSAARTPADIRPARAPDEEAKERAVKCVVTLLLVLATSIPAAAADDASPEVKVTRLGETLYELTTDQGAYTTNSLVSVGDDGLLIVDTQSRKDGVGFRKAIEAFGKGSPSIIVNTHRHSEHVGGNELFGEAPIVIAHALVRGKLRSGSYLFDEFPDSALPDISFTDSLSVHFNGEEIRLIAMPGSHDDNEIIVHFTKSKVVHLSSLANGFNFPSVDADGDVLRFEELVSKAIELLPPDVVIVSGHNRNGTIEDLRAYREMLAATTAVVRDGLAAGKDAGSMKAEKVLDAWSGYAASYVSTDDWIDSLVAGLQGKEQQGRKVFDPLYEAYAAGGADAAIALYRTLRREKPEEFGFEDTDLLAIGDKLFARELYEPAVQFLEASLAEYPGSIYSYYANYELAVAHDRLGHHEAAIRYCRTAAEQNPDSTRIAAFLEELTGRPSPAS